MKFRTKKTTDPGLPPLVLPLGDGTSAYNFPGAVVDNLRYMVTRILRNGQLPARLAIVSALRQEGVTYLAHALAMTIAHDMALRVCIVDLNWWWPSTSVLAAQDNPGLAGVIAEEATLEEIIAPTGWSNLDFVPAGILQIEHRPAVARSQVLRQIIISLSKQYDHLILDIPAILATNDAIPLASLGDGCCLIIRQGATTVEDVRLALDEIDHMCMLGVVMNQVRLSTPAPILKLIPSN